MPGSCCFGDAEQLTITDSAALGRVEIKNVSSTVGGFLIFFPFRSGDKLTETSKRLRGWPAINCLVYSFQIRRR